MGALFNIISSPFREILVVDAEFVAKLGNGEGVSPYSLISRVPIRGVRLSLLAIPDGMGFKTFYARALQTVYIQSQVAPADSHLYLRDGGVGGRLSAVDRDIQAGLYRDTA